VRAKKLTSLFTHISSVQDAAITQPTNSTQQVLLQKLTIPQIIGKFPAFWNPTIHHSAHNSLPLIPALSLINQVHTLPSYL